MIANVILAAVLSLTYFAGIFLAGYIAMIINEEI